MSVSCVQVLRAVTSSSTTCRRSSPTLRSCRCSCPSGTSSLQRSLLTAPPTRVNASVSRRCDRLCDSWCGLLVFRHSPHSSFLLSRPPQVLWVSTTHPARRLPYRPWTASRLAWRDWRCSWRGPRMPTGLTEGGELLYVDVCEESLVSRYDEVSRGWRCLSSRWIRDVHTNVQVSILTQD